MLFAAGVFIHKISFTQILEEKRINASAENKEHYLENVPTDTVISFVDDAVKSLKRHISLYNGKLSFISNLLYLAE